MICLALRTWSIYQLSPGVWFTITLDGYRCGPFKSWKEAYILVTENALPSYEELSTWQYESSLIHKSNSDAFLEMKASC
jgi:hypothetical protein